MKTITISFYFIDRNSYAKLVHDLSFRLYRVLTVKHTERKKFTGKQMVLSTPIMEDKDKHIFSQ